jgi:GT2 family glycosyltransferase
MSDTSMNRSVSVILPNYNGRHLLEKNLPSLYEALGDIEYEVIVVDDCSPDDSVAFLQQNYPQIKIIQSEVNSGFSATCNRGIKAADRELLCIVNTDVTFTPDYFTTLLPEFTETGLFAVKGDIVNYENKIEDAINTDRTTLIYYRRGFLRFDTRSPLTNRTLISGSDRQIVFLGCCFVCDRKIMQQLSGFDEIYSPFYWEDADLAQRALNGGFKLLYLPEAMVYHQASSTIGSYRSYTLRRLVSNRNKFLFSWRHLDARRIWLSHIPITVLNLLFRWLVLDWKYYAAFFWAAARKLTFTRQPL